jgi:hypothetical protein
VRLEDVWSGARLAQGPIVSLRLLASTCLHNAMLATREAGTVRCAVSRARSLPPTFSPWQSKSGGEVDHTSQRSWPGGIAFAHTLDWEERIRHRPRSPLRFAMLGRLIAAPITVPIPGSTASRPRIIAAPGCPGCWGVLMRPWNAGELVAPRSGRGGSERLGIGHLQKHEAARRGRPEGSKW